MCDCPLNNTGSFLLYSSSASSKLDPCLSFPLKEYFHFSELCSVFESLPGSEIMSFTTSKMIKPQKLELGAGEVNGDEYII